MKLKQTRKENKKGFTLFLSLVIAGTLLVVATGVVTLAVRQSRISTAGRDSQLAFYAADTGLECALYWDVRNPSGVTAFDAEETASINCNQDDDNPSNQWTVGGSTESQFTMTFLPEDLCAIVTVTKGAGNSTVIESLGYNSCDSANPRRVERAVRAEY